MILLSTGSLYTFGLQRVFALAAQAGFEGVEILIDERWDTRQADYLRRLSGEYQLPIHSLHNPFTLHIPGCPTDPVESVKASTALAQELGVKTIVLHLPLRVGYVVLSSFKKRRLRLPTYPSPFAGLRRWMERQLTAFEAHNGVRLCVENMPAMHFLGWRFDPCWWNTVDEWKQFPHLTLDTTHLGTWGLNPLEVYQQIKERVSHLHLSNFNGKEHRRLGDGHLPLADLLRAMRDADYQGAIVVELDPSALDVHDEAMVLAHLKAQVAFCRQYF